MVSPTLHFVAKVKGKEGQSPDCSLLIYTMRQMCYGISKKHSTKGLIDESSALNNEKKRN